ncbi:MAG: hypothetical protein AABW50_04625 [Nanoarchaeota archaeon]
MINSENIEFLNQLVNSLAKAEIKLEQAYQSQNYDEFNRLKKLMIQMQKRISETIE